MGEINSVRIAYDEFRFGQDGRMALDQWGDISAKSWITYGEKALIFEWEPWIKQAIQNVKHRSGKKRHGARYSVERRNFMAAVLIVALAMKRGDGPESVSPSYVQAKP